MAAKTSIRDMKKSKKKQAIVDAAIKVLARRGYNDTTVSHIAKEAGVADGTLYLYFKNKEDLLVKIFDEITEEFIEEGLQILAQVSSPLERLAAIAHLHLQKLGANEDLACIYQIELRHNARHMKMFSTTKLRKYFSIIEGVIKEAQEQGLLRPELNPWLTAKILFGALDEMATNWVLRKKDYQLDKMAQPTLDVLLNGMYAPNLGEKILPPPRLEEAGVNTRDR